MLDNYFTFYHNKTEQNIFIDYSMLKSLNELVFNLFIGIIVKEKHIYIKRSDYFFNANL